MSTETGGPWVGATAADPEDLRRERPWSRFPEPAESAFRTWQNARMRPLVLAIAWTSVAIWAVLPIATKIALGDDMPGGIWILEWGVNLPAVAVTTALMYSRLAAHTVFLSSAVVIVVGLATLVGVRWIFDLSGGAPACNGLFFAMLFPFMRVPFRSSAVAGVLLIGSAFAINVVDVARDAVALEEVWVTFSFMLAGTLMVPAVALLGELSLRQGFVQEQVIERQHQRLLENRNLIRRYVPPSVVEQIEDGKGSSVDTPVRRRVTILFSDVVGFTVMADRLDPESLTQVINEYLGMVADVVESHGGTLNEFAGDGFMAVFGAPAELPPEQQALGAIAAGREIHARLPVLNERWLKLGIGTPVRTRIGINTGVLSVGTFGSQGRATYTAIGLQTNIAARIQAQCEPGSILLSDATWHLVKDTVACEPRGEVEVKGVHFPIALYEPVAV